MPNVHPFFIPVVRASDIHDKMGDDAKWDIPSVLVSYNDPPTHPRAASLGLAVIAKPAGVLKIYLLKHVV